LNIRSLSVWLGDVCLVDYFGGWHLCFAIGDAFSGAILMLLFGLSAMPHLLLSQGIFNAVSKVRVPSVLKYTGAFVLIGIGLIGLWYSDMQQMPGFLCVLPDR
jgi:sulfite exporter TauE/SafE